MIRAPLPHSLRLALMLGLLFGTIASGSRADDAAPAEDAAVETADGDSAGEEQSGPRKWRRVFSGQIETGFDGAWDGSGSDLEIYEVLRLRAQPPNTPRIRFQGMLWTTVDLDGDEARYSSLYDLDDPDGGNLSTRLLELYLEADDVIGGAKLRVGRQRVLDGPLYNRIDGAHLKWSGQRWDAYAYAGAHASVYENTRDDLALGGGAGYRLSPNTRLGMDLYYGDQHRGDAQAVRPSFLSAVLRRRFPRRVETEIDDKLLGLSLYHRFGEAHWLRAQVLLLDDDAHEFTADFSGHVARWDLTYHLGYRHQFEQVEDRVHDVSRFYRILGPQERYHHVHASVQRPVTEKVTLGLEADAHAADNDSVYTANRDYVRAAGMIEVKDLYRGVNLSASLERWDVRDGEGAWIVTGEISRAWKRVKAAMGADYERYRDEYVEYNPWPLTLDRIATALLPGVFPGFRPWIQLSDERTVETREDVYSVYTKFSWKISERQRFTSRVIFETDDGPDSPYWRVQAGYELDF